MDQHAPLCDQSVNAAAVWMHETRTRLALDCLQNVLEAIQMTATERRDVAAFFNDQATLT